MWRARYDPRMETPTQEPQLEPQPSEAEPAQPSEGDEPSEGEQTEGDQEPESEQPGTTGESADEF